jgi:hypothetical protein
LTRNHTTALVASAAKQDDVAAKVAATILKFIGDIPTSDKHKSRTPAEAARKAANAAATKAAAAAGTLALPPGPLGWLTILPEMLAVWRIQAQMVADIAAFHGKKGALNQEQMLYCLFRHSASQAVRDLVVRVGKGMLVRRATLGVLQSVARRVGVNVTQRVVATSVTRWLPVVGALGVAAYAYYDTAQVARIAMDFFEHDIEVEPEPKDA